MGNNKQWISEVTRGPHQIQDLVYAVGGIDADQLLNFDNRNGLSAEAILDQMSAQLGQANLDAVNLIRSLVYFTTDDHARYRQGDSGADKTPVLTEYADPDPIRSDETGHMLPLRDFGEKLGWTWQYLRDAYQSHIDNDLALLRERWMNRVIGEFLWRIFYSTEQFIGDGGGYSVGWAIGSGVNVPYIPPQFLNKGFDTTHTHYQFVNGTSVAKHKELLDNCIKELRHHGITGRLLALVSEDDIDTWAAVKGFVEYRSSDIQIIIANGLSDEERNFRAGVSDGVPGETFGFYTSTRGEVELRYMPEIPDGYVWVCKSEGDNNAMNPVAIRLHPTTPFGLIPEAEITSTTIPKLKAVNARGAHGFGVNKRIRAAAGYIADGAASYVNPPELSY